MATLGKRVYQTLDPVVLSKFSSYSLKTNVHISDSCLTYIMCLCMDKLWIGYFSGFVVSYRMKVYLKQSAGWTLGISAWGWTALRYAVPTELPWEFPSSMMAKSLQPQNTRQLLWAVGKRNRPYMCVYVCTHSCCNNSYVSMIHSMK